MNLMISETASQREHSVARNNAPVDVIFHSTGECTLGRVLVARSVKGVCAILIGDTDDELVANLATRFPRATHVTHAVMIRSDLAKVIRFVEKPAEGLDVTLDMRGTPFQLRVWEKLRALPVGRTISYTDLARLVGPQTSPRAVANACAANPIALAVPCHRVVRNNGDLAGYRWGIERKRSLIEKEAMA